MASARFHSLDALAPYRAQGWRDVPGNGRALYDPDSFDPADPFGLILLRLDRRGRPCLSAGGRTATCGASRALPAPLSPRAGDIPDLPPMHPAAEAARQLDETTQRISVAECADRVGVNYLTAQDGAPARRHGAHPAPRQAAWSIVAAKSRVTRRAFSQATDPESA